MPSLSAYLGFFLLSLCLATVHGALRFANYYQDHMVLQRAPQRAVVWGYADTFKALIKLTMNNKSYYTISSSSPADSVGASIWSVTLDAQTAEGPFQVQVSQPLANGTLENITLNDVLFGDVWVCSGQSNMQFHINQMFNSSIEIQNVPNYPKIRLLNVADAPADSPQEEIVKISLNWSIPTTAIGGGEDISAVCWLYGRMVQAQLGGRPMGLITSYWGGTPIEFWSPPEALKDCGITQTRSITSANNGGIGLDAGVSLSNSVLYNGMIYPLTRLVIKGALWYQGENNSDYNRDKYNCTLAKMIGYWRSTWYARTGSITDPNFPFGVVQLSTNERTGTVVGGFPWIRWHQTFDVGYLPNTVVPNVFMAVTIDLRDDENGVHPRDKLDVGYRLSRSGLAVAYGFNNITYLGPIIDSVSVASDSSKLNVTYSNVASPAVELRNPNGFEVCCAGKQVCSTNDGAWVATPASAIQGVALTITLTVPNSCASKAIDGLRYLWRETPCLFKQAAVYNSLDANLPAPPYLKYFS